MSKAEQFVSLGLLARDLSHLAHWKTGSYAEHVTLQEFYDGLLELLDAFVEQYQGYYNKRLAISRAADSQEGDIKEVIEYQCEWIERNRYDICDEDESALQNTLDEILRLYQTTLYKLTLE